MSGNRLGYFKEYYQKHRKEVIRRTSEHNKKILPILRAEVHNLLGGKCARCGYAGSALQIHHVNNDGAKDRKTNGMYCTHYLRRIRKSILAGEGRFQLLCANCNIEFFKEVSE